MVMENMAPEDILRMEQEKNMGDWTTGYIESELSHTQAERIFTCQCGWEGTLEELGKRWVRDPKHPDDVNPELACPECGSFNLEVAKVATN